MKYLGMIIHCLGITIAGIWFSTALFNSKWPHIYQLERNNSQSNILEKIVTIRKNNIATAIKDSKSHNKE